MTTNTNRIADRVALIREHPDKPYFTRYRIETGRFGKDDRKPDEGLTQDLICISCITQPDGGYSQSWTAMDGATGEAMHHDDVFKAWILMASSLREKADLDPAKRLFVDEVFEKWRAQLLIARGRG